MQIDATTSKTLQNSELLEQSLKIAAFLLEIGVKQGDVIGIVTENCIEFPAILYGAFYLGATVNACNVSYSTDELRHVFGLTRPRVVFASTTALPTVLSVANKCDYVQDIIAIGHSIAAKGKVLTLEDIYRNRRLTLPADFRPAPLNKDETVGLILVSSGTTGLPKGVLISQTNILVAISIAL